MKNNVIFRVDASSQIGWGHLFRCVGMAEIFRKQRISSHILTKNYNNEAINTPRQDKFPVSFIDPQASYEVEIKQTTELIQKLQCKLFVVDLSNPLVLQDIQAFQQYLIEIKKSGVNILLFDGLGNDCITAQMKIPVDILVIPYIGAEDKKLKITSHTFVLRGTDYFIVRSNLKKYARKHKKIKNQVKTILLALGKGWEKKVILKIISLLAKTRFKNQIIGFSDSGILSVIKRFTIQSNVINIKLIQNSNKFPQYLYACDILITGSGLTKYEAAALGIPTIGFSQNQDQEKMMHIFSREESLAYGGIVKNLSKTAIINKLENIACDYDLRLKMSKNGKRIIDTNGGERILKVLLQKNYI